MLLLLEKHKLTFKSEFRSYNRNYPIITSDRKYLAFISKICVLKKGKSWKENLYMGGNRQKLIFIFDIKLHPSELMVGKTLNNNLICSSEI